MNKNRYFFLLLVLFVAVTANGVARERPFPRFSVLIDDTTQVDDEMDRFVENMIEKIQSRVTDYVSRRFDDPDASSKSGRTTSDYSDLTRSSSSQLTFNGDMEVAKSDTLRGDVLVKNGTLRVYGVIEGNATVLNGNMFLADSSWISGNARAINGKIKTSKDGTLGGYTDETYYFGDEVDEFRPSKKRALTTFTQAWLREEMFPDNLTFRYNRVEGFFLGLGAEKKFYWDGRRTISGYGSAGYGFATHRWRLNLGLDRQFAANDALYEIGAEAHSITDTKDEWRMKLWENNLVALLWHEDYRDYFGREGFSVHVARYSKEPSLSTQLRVDYLIDRYKSLENGTNWSVFRQLHSFRNNPAIQEGWMRSLVLTAGLSTVERVKRLNEGWDLYFCGEAAGDQLGADFMFKQAVVDIRRYQPVASYAAVNVRVRGGTLEGKLLPQKSFELGGANTMPAYGFKEFSGNRMLLGNAEFLLSGRVLRDVSFWPSMFDIIVFGDAGTVDTVATSKSFVEGFDAFAMSSIKSDVGFALATHDDGMRLGFAWRTDSSAPVSVYFRFTGSF
ncbi:MAG: DUF5686 family protein [Ignavibacteriales bacterium]|nr:DUF5686 family protein [Ignavibacteriales bacterium]